MHFALVTENFPPVYNSGAVQLRDLAKEFARQGHQITVIVPSSEQKCSWDLSEIDGYHVLRLKSLKTKDVGYVRRTVAEFFMPFLMSRNFFSSSIANQQWDGIIWYSPSIFHGPFVKKLKLVSSCPAYLIIRDIFPEWAVDMGLMSRGVAYRFFDAVARFQYSIADVIGVQTNGNRSYFLDWEKKAGRKLEILPNWLDKPAQTRCSIRLSETLLFGRKIFVYAGNMGVAQGMGILLDLAEYWLPNSNVGFLFVGRGSDALQLKNIAGDRGLANILFFDEIHPDEIPDLYAQCNIGLIALDPRHKSHNIPGKFLTYMQSGLPVLANINKGNDLAEMIRDEGVGEVCESNNINDLVQLSEKLLRQINVDIYFPIRCRKLFDSEFSAERAVNKIVNSIVN